MASSKWNEIYTKLNMNDPEFVRNVQDFSDNPEFAALNKWLEALNINNVPSESDKQMFQDMAFANEGNTNFDLKEFGLDLEDLELNDEYIQKLEEEYNALDPKCYDDSLTQLKKDYESIKCAIKELEGKEFPEFLVDRAISQSRQQCADISAHFEKVLQQCKVVIDSGASGLNEETSMDFMGDYESAVDDFTKSVEFHVNTILNNNDTVTSLEEESDEPTRVLKSKLLLLRFSCVLEEAKGAGLDAALELLEDGTNGQELDNQDLNDRPDVSNKDLLEDIKDSVTAVVEKQILEKYSQPEIDEGIHQKTSLLQFSKELNATLRKQRSLHYVVILLLAFQTKQLQTSLAVVEEACCLLEKKARNAEIRIASLESAKKKIAEHDPSIQDILKKHLPVISDTSQARKVSIPAEKELDAHTRAITELIKERERDIAKMTQVFDEMEGMEGKLCSLPSFAPYLNAFKVIKSKSERLHKYWKKLQHKEVDHEGICRYQLLWIDHVLHGENFEELSKKLEENMEMLLLGLPTSSSTPIYDKHKKS